MIQGSDCITIHRGDFDIPSRKQTLKYVNSICSWWLDSSFSGWKTGPDLYLNFSTKSLQWLNSLPLEIYNGEGNSTPLQYSCLENPIDGGAWWDAVHGVSRSQTWLSDFTFTFHFRALEKEMATHSSVLAWRIPGVGEPGGLPSMGSHRVGHDWSDLAAADICQRKAKSDTK